MGRIFSMSHQFTYHDCIVRYFLPRLIEDLGGPSSWWFMQDGAPSHTTEFVRSSLDSIFNGQVISLRGDYEWPPNSPDLNPMDFSVWGLLEDQVRSSNSATASDLKQLLTRSVNIFTPQLYLKIINSFRKRVDWCREQQGAQFEYTIN